MYQPEAGEKQMAYSTWVTGGEISKGTFQRGESRVQEVSKGQHEAQGLATVVARGSRRSITLQIEGPRKEAVQKPRGWLYGQGCLGSGLY